MKIGPMRQLNRTRARPRTACKRGRRSGQALVELALAITFISLLLGAAVDLGLAYKTYQTLMNATAEASTYLALNPLINCDTNPCPAEDPTPSGGADLEARNRFREEQGGTIRGSASTMDLNANRVDDASESFPGYANGWQWIAHEVRIDEADSDQVQMSGGVYGLAPSYDPAQTDPRCQARYRFGSGSKQCFIVVRTEMFFHPYISARLLGASMPIHAVSVKPIVGGP